MRCIFCKKDSSTSRSVEHIMPESIGNKKRILRAGIVCDTCNNYFARKVEEPVLSHHSMRNLKALYQIPNKRGKYPSLQGEIGGTDIAVGLRRDREGQLQIEAENGKDRDHLKAELEIGIQNGIFFKIETDPPKREMSRFLCKMALETIAEFCYEDKDDNFIIESSFYDHIRTYARCGNNFLEWPYSQRQLFPRETLMRHPDTNEWIQCGFGCCWFMNKRRETLFAFLFYGTEFVINVGGPSIAGYEEWLEEHGHISPMVERVGGRLTTEGKGLNQIYYIHGDFNMQAGFDFDQAH